MATERPTFWKTLFRGAKPTSSPDGSSRDGIQKNEAPPHDELAMARERLTSAQRRLAGVLGELLDGNDKARGRTDYGRSRED